MPAKNNLAELQLKRSQWHDINSEVLDPESYEKFVIRKRAVDLYIDGLNPKNVAENTGISSSEVIRLVRRCSVTDENGAMPGYTALLPHKHVRNRIGKLGKLFLEYPTLESFVLGNYFGDKQYTLERNMSIRTLHVRFIDECIRLGIPDYEYPFTIKDKGYYALYSYIKHKKLEMQNSSIIRENKNAVQHFTSTGFGISNSINPIAPFNIVQIDGHKIDLLYTVEVENESGEIVYMPATRCWLIAVIDVATRTIVGYSLTQNENYNQYDVLHAIHNSIVPHQKMDFSHKSLHYPKNGGFPSTAIPESQWAVFDMIMLDNAKSHLATNVLNKLTSGIKCTVNFGSVATPETRGIVERFFRTLETQGFHRLPGTTGSNIFDNKRKHPEKESVKYRISYNDICELVEYLIAEYNTSAHSSLENQTPLQVMQRRITAGAVPYIIPASQRPDISKLTYFTVERTLRGGYKTGLKPHLSYKGVKYHAYNTSIPMQYIGQKVYIEVNPADVSHVDLYDKNGIFIAKMIASGEWGRRPHSLKTHEAAMKRKNKNAETNTPFTPHLSEFEEELRQNSKHSRRDRTQASIVRSECSSTQKTENDQQIRRYSPPHEPSKKTTYTAEEIQAFASMSLEEARKKGLI